MQMTNPYMGMNPMLPNWRRMMELRGLVSPQAGAGAGAGAGAMAVGAGPGAPPLMPSGAGMTPGSMPPLMPSSPGGAASQAGAAGAGALRGMDALRSPIAAMKQGISSPLGAVGSIANLALTDWNSPEGIGAGLGGTAGGLIGQAAIPIPVVGSIIGSAVGNMLGKLTGGLFGDDEEEEKLKKKQKFAALNENLMRTANTLSQGNQAMYQRARRR